MRLARGAGAHHGGGMMACDRCTESRTKAELAIKVERKYSRKPQLPFESQVYKRLNQPFMKSIKPPGFPNLRYLLGYLWSPHAILGDV